MKTSRYIAKVFGLTGVLLSLVFLASGGGLIDRLIESMSEGGFLFMSGTYTLIIGVALVVGHNVWDGSWRVVITVIGYLTLLKGIVLLAWPDAMLEITKGMQEGGVMQVQILFGVVFYGWLTWMGFRREKAESSPEPAT